MRFKSPNDLNKSYKIPYLLKHKAEAPFLEFHIHWQLSSSEECTIINCFSVPLAKNFERETVIFSQLMLVQTMKVKGT
jgi:hypothetical protein